MRDEKEGERRKMEEESRKEGVKGARRDREEKEVIPGCKMVKLGKPARFTCSSLSCLMFQYPSFNSPLPHLIYY